MPGVVPSREDMKDERDMHADILKAKMLCQNSRGELKQAYYNLWYAIVVMSHRTDKLGEDS